MKYIKLFNQHSDYVNYKSSEDYVNPTLSYCIDEDHTHLIDWTYEYLSFDSSTDFNIKFVRNSTSQYNYMLYSLNDGNTWEDLQNDTSVNIPANTKIMFKGDINTNNILIGRFYADKNFKALGNVRSLIYGDDFIYHINDKLPLYAFYQLFSGSKIQYAHNLILSGDIVSRRAYSEMFNNTPLLTPPKLPATKLEYAAYQDMFNNSALTYAPEIPVTEFVTSGNSTLSGYECSRMFKGCGLLKKGPSVLPATTLTEFCYEDMFRSCTSLTTTPEILVTTAARGCCKNMFADCNALTKGPSILPATTLADECYWGMFDYCYSLRVAPELPATTLVSSCYRYMFERCNNLMYIKADFLTDIVANTDYTWSWVDNVLGNGVFIKNPNATWERVTGAASDWRHNIPINFDVITYVPENTIIDTVYNIINNDTSTNILSSPVNIKNYTINDKIFVDDVYQGKSVYKFNKTGLYNIKFDQLNITKVKSATFYGISNLKSVIIPDGISIIEPAAFSNCSTLESVTLPNTLLDISSNAFLNCYSLTDIIIPNNVSNIGLYAFLNCTSLTNATINSGKIDNYAFQNCSSLTTVTLGTGVTTIGTNAFNSCSSLTDIIIPDNVTSIGYTAFLNCYSLTSVIIGNGVTSIATAAFVNCSTLTNVTIGTGITLINSAVFNSCPELISVTINATTPPTLYSGVFEGNASGRKIYVPAASVETYKAASGWSTYANDIVAIS